MYNEEAKIHPRLDWALIPAQMSAGAIGSMFSEVNDQEGGR
jgi:hypothetical protein